MSHVATNRLLTKLGADHDSLAKEWRNQLVSCLKDNDFKVSL